MSLAAGFSLGISPPRLELHANPGEALQQTLEIRNSGATATQLQIELADWNLSADGELHLGQGQETLKDGCRPWILLSAPTVNVAPRQWLEYFFTVSVPPRQPAGECRFAVLLRDASQEHGRSTDHERRAASFPATGQIAVIGYITVGAARADLTIEKIYLDVQATSPQICVDFYNQGNAHTRVDGRLRGVAANGAVMNFLLPPLAVLPGERRVVIARPLDPDGSHGNLVEWRPPISVQGKITWPGGQYMVDKVLLP